MNTKRNYQNRKPYRNAKLKEQAKKECVKVDGRWVAPHVPTLKHVQS